MRKFWSVFAFLGFATVIGVGLSLRPWEVYIEQKAKTDKAVQEMREIEARRAELMDKKARYESAVGREEIARERGYLKPGEKPIDPNNPVVSKKPVTP